jgi:hypothetical protein
MTPTSLHSTVAGRNQVWVANGWFARFALSLDPADTG